MRQRCAFHRQLCLALLPAAALTAPAAAQTPAAVVTVDAAASRHPISPLVYGVAYGSTGALADLNCPLNRMGGNNTTRYNWQINADNKASDYYFESIGDSDPTPGKRGDDFIAQSRAGGAQAMLTIPMLGWVANLGPGRGKLSSFSVKKYGPQQSTDYWMPDAGNGVSTSGQNITGNDPNDADVPSNAAFQAGWMSHLVGTWGTAASGGLGYYILDNEPSIWHATHRDVHPHGEPMQEEMGDILAYAAQVKAADPSALTVGPEEWGWSGYLYSGADQQFGSQHGWGSLPDRAAHGGMDYLPWLLQQLQQNNAATGKRLLDVFSVHFYPQGGEYGNDTSQNTELLRNRSTRQLWDPNYVSESWIGTQVQLIPRLKNWVAQYYPGTKTAITEYNWGAEGSINGATTQADIFGIFGRESLDLATRWTTPDPSTPTYLAMKLYRNYDGAKSGFGDTSVSDAVADPDNLSSFAAVRSADGALTVMIINKALSGSTPVTVSLANFIAGAAAQAWQLTSANAITRLADVPVSGGSISATVPAQSITLLVVPAGAAPAPTPPPAPTGLLAAAGNGRVSLKWNDGGAATYNVYRGTGAGAEAATPIATGLTGPAYTDTTLSNGETYIYQVTAVNAIGESGRSAEVSATPAAPVVTASPGVAIDCGGGASGAFAADTDYVGGAAYGTKHTVSTAGVAGAAPPAVYQSSRYGKGGMRYVVPKLTPGAAYAVRLHFAETYWNAAGKRVFSVALNGQTVLTNFDIWAAAGGADKAIVKQFTATADSGGVLTLTFTNRVNFAQINGIEVNH